MLFTFLLIIQSLVAALMVAVILMQKSEGGGLGVGGSPSGLMSARGAADFLTRATAILATIFVVLSIVLAAYATLERGSSSVDTSLIRRQAAPASGPLAPAGQPPAQDPLAGAARQGAPATPATPTNGSVPLAQ